MDKVIRSYTFVYICDHIHSYMITYIHIHIHIPLQTLEGLRRISEMTMKWCHHAWQAKRPQKSSVWLDIYFVFAFVFFFYTAGERIQASGTTKTFSVFSKALPLSRSSGLAPFFRKKQNSEAGPMTVQWRKGLALHTDCLTGENQFLQIVLWLTHGRHGTYIPSRE